MYENGKKSKIKKYVAVILLFVLIAASLVESFNIYAEQYIEHTSQDTPGSVAETTQSAPQEIQDVEDVVEEPVLGSSESLRTIYFDTSGNGTWSGDNNGWTKDGTMYIYLYGDTEKAPAAPPLPAMTPSAKAASFGLTLDGKLWEYEVDISKYHSMIIVNKSDWSGGNACQTVDIKLSDYTGQNPCFKLNGGSSESRKTVDVTYLKPLSIAGKTINFFNMSANTQNLTGVKAVFSGNGLTETSVEMTKEGNYYTVNVPADVNSTSYTNVQFKDASNKSLGDVYNLLGNSSDGVKAITYSEDSVNTFYYGATEKADGTKISVWGEKTTSTAEINGKTIYFDKVHFPVAVESKIQIGDGKAVVLAADSEDTNTYSYEIPADSKATQQTILTFIGKNNIKYNFLWSDLTKNEVTLSENIASVTKVYSKGNTVYFDATFSKLVYSAADGTNGAGDGKYGIPNKEGVIRFYATGAEKDVLEGDMELVPEYSNGTNTWTDVYKVDLPEGYTNIAFSSFDMTSIDNYGGHGESTVKLTIPTDIANPCFYADTSDLVIYDGGTRGGYWDEVYTIRNAEKNKGTDVVDIPKGTETRDEDRLYVNTTYYDFYTDYELNGENRDTYTYNANNHRIYQPFRQFNQALSEYYKANSASSPIYWGNFQHATWGSPFYQIAGDLNLYGYDSNNTNKFFYQNNSMWGFDGGYLNLGDQNGQNATVGLVSDTLKDGKLMMKTSNGTVEVPYLNESFLSGNNAKNTVLGEVYKNVSFPFKKAEMESESEADAVGKVEYWYFNSKEPNNYLRMTQDSKTGSYYLNPSNDLVQGQTTEGPTTLSGKPLGNFFPFNGSEQGGNAGKLNYGFASKMEFKFRLTKEGTVYTDVNEEVPIEFNFSGDDDVWIFIDGKLALDIGGGHDVVKGHLNFRDLEYYVTRVKNDTKGGYTNDVTGTFELSGDKTSEHTLTMFYMERGIWESNMYVSFNFPEENTLEVQKTIDESNVNQELFGGLFDKAPIYPFTIKNLATHYGTKEVDNSDVEQPVVFNDTFESDKLSKSSNENTFEQTNDPTNSANTVVHWLAKYSDIGGTYKDKRFGIVSPASGKTVEASKVSDYLQFKYYCDEANAPALNYMYIELEDNSGNKIGGYLSGKIYGNTLTKAKKWSTLTVDLSKLAGGKAAFDYSNIKSVKFNYDLEADFYLDDITFKSKGVVEVLHGFTKKDEEIPDYGSATSGQLEKATGAVYTIDSSAENYRVDEEGVFVLNNGETATFRDQFRRGSYLAIEEEVDSHVFDTTYTVYENGMPVTTMNDGDTINLGPVTNLQNVSGTAVDDGRTEVYMAEDENGNKIGNKGYTATQKPDGKTTVYRSYQYPDSRTGTTKLKYEFINKVKTGSLTIKKEGLTDTDNLTGSYKFKITFYNVAGMGIEGDKTITKEITLKAGESHTITGIPFHTNYSIEELKPEDDSTLDSVVEDNGNAFDINAETKVVSGVIKNTTAQASFTFRNTKKPLISLDVEKLWKDTNGNTLTEKLPDSITIQLQRRVAGNTGNYTVVEVEGQNQITLKPSYDGWTYHFESLDRYVDYTQAAKQEWEYRVVELDSEGKAMEEGSSNGHYNVTYTGKTDDTTGNISYTITNIYDARTNIQIIKVDAVDNNKKLSDVEFTLEKIDDKGEVDNSFKKQTVVTDNNGIGKFANLEDGNYRITETKTREEYSLLKKPITVVIKRNGSSTVNDKEYTVEDDTITITVGNKAKFRLPFTGGYGRTIVMFIGLALIAAAALIYVLWKKDLLKGLTFLNRYK
ncbi:MAG: hypothetical protein IJA36_08110 [Lachnospiraceae bacterium]|nr:hypothetical protein [Lachnospiraceae bacterium]